MNINEILGKGMVFMMLANIFMMLKLLFYDYNYHDKETHWLNTTVKVT